MVADKNGAIAKFAIRSAGSEISVCFKKSKDIQPKKLAPRNHKKLVSQSDSDSGVTLFLEGQSKGIFTIDSIITSNKN